MLNTLTSVRHLRFTASSNLDNAGWNGEGTGEVEVQQQGNVVIYNERGSWTTSEGVTLAFKNIFRWTHIPERDAYQLEHLRFGEQNAVFLFELVPTSPGNYTSKIPHRCAADIYTGELILIENGFKLMWCIKGPKKDEQILYTYY